jgi:alpha-beta hydrolase superfamily lysophospholipase
VSHNGPLSPLVVEEQTTDEHERQLIFKDARRYPGYIMNKSGYEVLKMIAASKEAAKAIKTPFMCLHGADDKICLVAGSDYFMKSTATLDDKKTLVIMPGLKHDVLHEVEPHRSEATNKVVDFFDQHYSA